MKEGAYCTMIDYSTLNSNLKRGILSKISWSLNDRNKYYGYFIGHNEKCYCQYRFIHFSQIFPTFTPKMSKQRKCTVPTFTQKGAAFYCRPLYKDLIRHFMTLAHIFS